MESLLTWALFSIQHTLVTSNQH